MTIANTIYKMFGQSPIGPLEKHMGIAHHCAELLLPVFEAAAMGDWARAEEIHREIDELERQADDLKRDIRIHLPKNLFLPVARGDVLALITYQDRIANKAKDLSGLLVSRRMQLPTATAILYLPLLKTCIDASKQAHIAINELDELLETGFSDKVIGLVGEMLTKLNAIEHATDEMQKKIRRQIFEHESELPPIEVMFLYKMIEWTGELADIAQNVGGQLQIMLAH